VIYKSYLGASEAPLDCMQNCECKNNLVFVVGCKLVAITGFRLVLVVASEGFDALNTGKKEPPVPNATATSLHAWVST